jgi:hypothetical protein
MGNKLGTDHMFEKNYILTVWPFVTIVLMAYIYVSNSAGGVSGLLFGVAKKSTKVALKTTKAALKTTKAALKTTKAALNTAKYAG